MTGDSLARRIQSAAARSQTKLPETTQRAWHDADMIKLGKGRARKDHNGSLEDTSALLTRPASLAFIFLTAFLIILAVLLWQSLGMLGSAAVAQQAGKLEHLMVHNQDADHHHHADHALHMDSHADNLGADGDGPVQHLHADSGTNTTGPLTSFQPAVAAVRSMSPPQTRYALWRSPTLEGPLRPPT